MDREQFIDKIIEMYYKMPLEMQYIANTLVVVVEELSDFDYSDMAKRFSKELGKEIKVVEKLANEKHIVNSVYFAQYGYIN